VMVLLVFEWGEDTGIGSDRYDAVIRCDAYPSRKGRYFSVSLILDPRKASP
jgi:hypothetical protein